MDGFQIMGTYYGYPQCCKDWFSQHAGEHNEEQLKVNGSTGFMPCPTHAHQIVKEEITLVSLIENRICKTPFPDGGSRVAASDYYYKEFNNPYNDE